MPGKGKTKRTNGIFICVNVMRVVIIFRNNKIHKTSKTFPATRAKNSIADVLAFISCPFFFKIFILYIPQKPFWKKAFYQKF